MIRIKTYILCAARQMWRHKWWVGSGVALLAAVLIVPIAAVTMATASARYSAANEASFLDVPPHDVAIVFGAGVTPQGQPTPYLRQRVETAVNLYKAGKAKHLLMSGDNRTTHYNEPEVMGRLAQSLGVPASAITLDYAGYNTYDTCYRAKHIFGIDSALVVSQAYHVPRAVMACSGAGIATVGVDAVHTGRDFGVLYELRETLAIDKAFLQLFLQPASTVGGAPEPIAIQK
jgi:vancomycin permeability regulator SanA